MGDRRNISLIDLVDGTIYDHILTSMYIREEQGQKQRTNFYAVFNIDVITYEPHSKQVFAGMDDGIIKCWRSSRAKITVGNMDPRYHTVDRPCITMKGRILLSLLSCYAIHIECFVFFSLVGLSFP